MFICAYVYASIANISVRSAGVLALPWKRARLSTQMSMHRDACGEEQQYLLVRSRFVAASRAIGFRGAGRGAGHGDENLVRGARHFVVRISCGSARGFLRETSLRLAALWRSWSMRCALCWVSGDSVDSGSRWARIGCHSRPSPTTSRSSSGVACRSRRRSSICLYSCATRGWPSNLASLFGRRRMLSRGRAPLKLMAPKPLRSLPLKC